MRTLRDYPGSGRDPLQPVPAAVQRQALDADRRATCSAADGLTLSPGAAAPAGARLPGPRRVPRSPTDYAAAAAPAGPAARRAAAADERHAWPRACSTAASKFDRPADAFQLSRALRPR
ncbi:MAG: hypothetical protein MZW92_56005 [Comamonadaceae bacterium]|nr:hypothetical protein [Comamonadaceae bacterium]